VYDDLVHTLAAGTIAILSAPGPLGGPLAPGTPVSDTLARLLLDVGSRQSAHGTAHLLLENSHLAETARALCAEPRTVTVTRGIGTPEVTR
jgi:hypothetical protein